MADSKTFLLMMPEYSDFPNLFLENLKKAGFSPYLITDHPSEFRYHGAEKIINFLQKTIFRNREYKEKLVNDHKLKAYSDIISNLEMLDYVLVIRPDAFPISIFEQLKSKTRKMIAYQWDGIEKFPNVKQYIPLFDSFFCFENETQDNRLKPITNFFFDHIEPVYKAFNIHRPKLYFVGVYWDRREQQIDDFIEKVSPYPMELNILIQYYHKHEIKNPKIKYLKNRISFSENLKNVQECDVLVDFVDPIHNGLSFRFFEGLYYKKKVITDNVMVKKYDFYHPDNILVLDKDNYDEIADFLKTPYHEIPSEVVEKYSFSSWIKKVVE